MNELKIFNDDVIPVYTTDSGEKVVIGRELHERLKIATEYKDWFPRMCEYGFKEPDDYAEFWENQSERIFERARFVSQQQAVALGYQKNSLIQLDMAKHIAMIQRTPEGKTIRQKLIALETNINELSPELQYLIKVELKQKEQEKALQEVNAKVDDTNKRIDNIGEIVALNPNSWRQDAKGIISKIAQAMGGYEYIRDVNHAVYELVDARAGCSLATRLTNKRNRMAGEGACKSKIDKLNKVDIIAEDKKLIEIYLSIVKEMAIKNGVGVSALGK